MTDTPEKSEKIHDIIDKYIQTKNSSHLIAVSGSDNWDKSHTQKLYTAAWKPENKEIQPSLLFHAFNSGLHDADHSNHFMDQYNSGAIEPKDVVTRTVKRVADTPGLDHDKLIAFMKKNQESEDNNTQIDTLHMPLPELRTFTQRLAAGEAGPAYSYPEHISTIIDESLGPKIQHTAQELADHKDFVEQHHYSPMRFFGEQQNSPPEILTSVADKAIDKGETRGFNSLIAHPNLPANYVAKSLKSDRQDISSAAQAHARIPDEMFKGFLRNGDEKAIRNFQENENLTKDQEAELYRHGYNSVTEHPKLSDQDKEQLFQTLPREIQDKHAFKKYYKESPSYIVDHAFNHGDKETRSRIIRTTDNQDHLRKALDGDDQEIALQAFHSKHLPDSVAADHIKTGKPDLYDISERIAENPDHKETVIAGVDKALSMPHGTSNDKYNILNHAIKSGLLSGDKLHKSLETIKKDGNLSDLEMINSYPGVQEVVDKGIKDNMSDIVTKFGEHDYDLSHKVIRFGNYSPKVANDLTDAALQKDDYSVLPRLLHTMMENNNLPPSVRAEIAKKVDAQKGEGFMRQTLASPTVHRSFVSHMDNMDRGQKRDDLIHDAIDTTIKHGPRYGLPMSAIANIDYLNEDHHQKIRQNSDAWIDQYHENEYPHKLNDQEITKVLSNTEGHNLNEYYLIKNLEQSGMIQDNKPTPQLMHHINSVMAQEIQNGDTQSASRLASKMTEIPGVLEDPQYREHLKSLSQKAGADKDEFMPGTQQLSAYTRNLIPNLHESNLPDQEKKQFLHDFLDSSGQNRHDAYSAVFNRYDPKPEHQNLLSDLIDTAPEGHPIIQQMHKYGILNDQQTAKHVHQNEDMLATELRRSFKSDKPFGHIKPYLDSLMKFHKQDTGTEYLDDILRNNDVFKGASDQEISQTIGQLIGAGKTELDASKLVAKSLSNKEAFTDVEGNYSEQKHHAVAMDAINQFIAKHPKKISLVANIVDKLPEASKGPVFSHMTDKALELGDYGTAAKMASHTPDGTASPEAQAKFVKDIPKILETKKKSNSVQLKSFLNVMSDDDQWSKALSMLHTSGKMNPEDTAEAIMNKPGEITGKSYSTSLDVTSRLLGSSEGTGLPNKSELESFAASKLLGSSQAANANEKQFGQLNDIFQEINNNSPIAKNINPSLAIKLIPHINNANQALSVIHSGYSKLSKDGFAQLVDKTIDILPADLMQWDDIHPLLKQNADKMGPEYSTKLASHLNSKLDAGSLTRLINSASDEKANQGTVMDHVVSQMVNDKDKRQRLLYDQSMDYLFQYLQKSGNGKQSQTNAQTSNDLLGHIADHIRNDGISDEIYENIFDRELELNDVKLTGPNTDKLLEATKNHYDPDFNIKFASNAEFSPSVHRKMASEPNGMFLLRHQKIHPDNMPIPDVISGIDMSASEANEMMSHVSDVVRKMDPSHISEAIDKWVQWAKTLRSKTVGHLYTGSLKGIAPHLTDKQIDQLPEAIDDIVQAGGGSPQFQAEHLSDLDPSTYKFVKDSPESEAFFHKNLYDIPDVNLKDLVISDKLSKQSIADLFDRSYDTHTLIQNPKLTKTEFDYLRTRLRNNPTYDHVFEVGKEWSPVFNVVPHGLNMFNDLTPRIPDTKNLNIKGQPTVSSVNASKTGHLFQELSSIIPPEGMDWGTFKRTAPKLANNKKIQDAFLASPKHTMTPELVNKAIVNNQDNYKVTYTKWDGAQRHSDQNNLVVQVNANEKLQKAIIEDKDLKNVYDYINESGRYSDHPNGPYTVGWARVDTSDPENWLIEETQSDFSAGLRKELDDIAKKGHKSIVINGKSYSIEEFGKYAKKIQDLTSGWLDAAHQAVNDTAKKAGVKGLYMHGHDVRAYMSGMNDPKPYPQWLQHMYIHYPPENGWTKTDYHKLKNFDSGTAKKVSKRPFGKNSLMMWKKPVT